MCAVLLFCHKQRRHEHSLKSTLFSVNENPQALSKTIVYEINALRETKEKKAEGNTGISRLSSKKRGNPPSPSPPPHLFGFPHYFANLFLAIMRIDAVYQ